MTVFQLISPTGVKVCKVDVERVTRDVHTRMIYFYKTEEERLKDPTFGLQGEWAVIPDDCLVSERQEPVKAAPKVITKEK